MKQIKILVVLYFFATSCIGYKAPDKQNIDKLKSESKSNKNLKIPEDWMFDRLSDSLANFKYDWIEELQDENVQQLINEGFLYNADIAIAAEKLNQLQLKTGIVNANALPDVNAGLLAENFTNGSYYARLQLQASYEIDLWGKLKSGREASSRAVYSAEFLNTRLKQTIASLIKKNYYTAIAGNVKLNMLLGYKLKTEELKRITEIRQRVGIANELDLSNINAELIQLDLQIEKVRNFNAQVKRTLELLVGRYPKGVIEVKDQFPALKTKVPQSIPFRLLENRPDILAAEFLIEQSFFQVIEAKAARLPAIRLIASTGGANSNIDFINSTFSNPFATIGSGLITPLFNGGALKKNLEIKNSQQKQSVEEYSKVVLTSLSEVESAWQNISSAESQYNYSVLVIDELNKNILLTNRQIEIGTSNTYDLLQKQRNLIQNEVTAVDVGLIQIIERINLYMAIGAKNTEPYF